MDVRLPDGRVVRNVPEGTTRAQLMQKLGMTEPQAAAPQRPLGRELGRQIGLGARYLVEGPANLIGMATNPITELMRMGGANVQTVPEAVSSGLTRLGLPVPENATERVVGDMSRAVSSLSPTVGAGRAVGGAVGRALAAAPISQTASAIGSAGAGGLAREQDVGAGGQLLANIAGGIAGGRLGSMAERASGMVRPQARPASRRMTASEVRQQAGEFYDEAADIGGAFKPEATDRILDKALSVGAPRMTSVGPTPRTSGELDTFKAFLSQFRGKPMTLGDVNAIDQELGDYINKYTSLGQLQQEGLPFMQMRDALREFARNPKADDVIGGTAGFDALKRASQEWSRSYRLGDVERIVNRAELMEQPSTGLRSGFRSILSNPSRTKGYSNEELRAMRQAAGLSTTTDLMRTAGSRLGSVVSGSLYGPAGFLANYALSAAARRGADAAQLAKADRLAQIIAGPNRIGQMPSIADDPQRLARILGTALGGIQ